MKKRINLKKIPKNKLIKVIAIVAVVLIILSVAAIKLGNNTSGLGKGINNVGNTVFGSSGFPYGISSNDVKNLGMSNSDIVVLNDTGVKVIDSTGRQISDFQHNYSSPLIYTHSSLSLVLDAGANKFRVQTSGKLIYEYETDFELLTGDVSKNGSVAIATKSDQGASMLTVFNSKKTEVFSWVCAKHYIISVDISDNGKYIAVGVIGADGGDIISEVFLFDINYTDAIRHFELPGTSVAKVEILSGKKLVIIGDNLVSFVNEKGTYLSTPFRDSVSVKITLHALFFQSIQALIQIYLRFTALPARRFQVPTSIFR